MQFSHSRVELFETCAHKYKLRYLDRLRTIAPDDPDNALILGQAMHTGIEKDVEAAVMQYFMSYPIITDDHINEAMKLEYFIPFAKSLLPEGGTFEARFANEDFTGYLDYLVPLGDPDYKDCGYYYLYDFKYSNNAARYRQSPQLHVYKHFFELMNPGKCILKMFYLIIPKVRIRQGKKESLDDFRRRIQKELSKAEPFLIPIEYDHKKVIDFLIGTKHTLEETVFDKNKSYLCNYCEYQSYCEKGEDFMLLPKNERRNIEKVSKRTIWLYGAPFSGKTTFANKFPDPLMLNTDGNVTFVDAPVIPIKNDVKVEGRITKTTLAWEVFKNVIEELEKKDNDFRTIIVDLVEDLYEHCRLFMYKEMGITHESDDSFRAWDKVRTEFLSTMKRLMNLDYENFILISHEDTSKDITKKSGDKITAIKPNLQEKTSNKVAGMVHIVARVIADGDVRTLSFKPNEVVFGGGRLTVENNEIPLDFDEFLNIFDEAAKNAASAMTGKNAKAEPQKSRGKTEPETPKEDPPMDEPVDNTVDASQDGAESVSNDVEGESTSFESEPVKNDSDASGEEPPTEPRKAENPPVVRTRKRRGE